MRDSHSSIQLDPSLPLIWEDTTTLRVGFERAVARVNASSPATQRLIARLVRGAPAEEIAAGDRAGTEAVLAALEPALVSSTVADREPASASQSAPPPKSLAQAPRRPVPDPPRHERSNPTGAASAPPRALRARLSDDGREVPWLRAALEASQSCYFPRGSAPELAVEVLRFLEPLGRTGRWLASGTPHLLIRFTDTAARVGPLIGTEGAPCHGCETLNLTERDPALPALASQLYGGVPSSETPESALFVAAIAAHFVLSWRRKERWVHVRQVALPVVGGTVAGLPTLSDIAAHPGCPCAISSGSRPPPQSGRVDAQSEPRSQSPTAAASRARA